MRLSLSVLIFWVIWTSFHLFLIAVVEDLVAKIFLSLYYIVVMIGITIMVRIENENSRNM